MESPVLFYGSLRDCQDMYLLGLLVQLQKAFYTASRLTAKEEIEKDVFCITNILLRLHLLFYFDRVRAGMASRNYIAGICFAGCLCSPSKYQRCFELLSGSLRICGYIRGGRPATASSYLLFRSRLPQWPILVTSDFCAYSSYRLFDWE